MGHCNLACCNCQEANIARLKEFCRVSVLKNKLFSNVLVLRLWYLGFAVNACLGSTKIVLQTLILTP